MKIIGKVFLGVLGVILLFSFSHASDKLTPLTTKGQVTFAWNLVTNYTPSGKHIGENDGKVMYVVYVYQANKIDEKPPIQKENIDKTKLRVVTLTPVKKPPYEISFVKTDTKKGHYFFLGVQALLYKKVSKDGIPIGEPINKSTISWSCNKDCTSNNPQYVYVP
jgi:hypothetical protein